MQPDALWTPANVADALVRAYGRIHGAPVSLTAAGRLDMASSDVAAMAWPDLYVRDPVDRRIVRMWGRCSATGESIRDYCREAHLPPSRFRRRRLAALDEIAAGLNRDSSAENSTLTLNALA